MEDKGGPANKNVRYVGVGIPIGAGVGAIVGLVLLNGDIVIGAGIGAGLGLVFGAMVDRLKSGSPEAR